jgi:hypothetical protein
MKHISTWRRVLSWEINPSPEKIRQWLIFIMETASETAKDDYNCSLEWQINNDNVVKVKFYPTDSPSEKRKYTIRDGGDHEGNNMISVQEEGNKPFHITAISSHLVAIMYAA